jgi:hypothetical protein
MAKRREKRECRAVVLEPDTAGIDIGAEEIYVAVPPDRDVPEQAGKRLWTRSSAGSATLYNWHNSATVG